MRILYFSFVELDIPNACQTHTLGVLRGLSYNGCHIDALVPRPLKMRPVIPAVRFFYLWPWRFSRMGKMWIKLLSALLMILLCLRNHYDAIYVREMETNPGPRLTSKLFKIPLYIEINDLIAPVLFESGFPASYVRRVKRHQEADFKQSYRLIIPSIPMCNWIIDQYGLPETKVHMIINGTDVLAAEKVSCLQAKEKLGLPPNSFCLGFVGNIYPRYDFKTILFAIEKCKKTIKKLYFIIVGNGPIINNIKEDSKKLNIRDNIIFTGYVQPDQLRKIIPAFDIGTLLLTKRAAQRYGPVTSKLATYGMYHLPVISAGNTLHGYPEEINKSIYLVAPGNSNILAKTIMKLYKDPKERKTRADMLYNFVNKELNWGTVVKKILDIDKS